MLPSKFSTQVTTREPDILIVQDIHNKKKLMVRLCNFNKALLKCEVIWVAF